MEKTSKSPERVQLHEKTHTEQKDRKTTFKEEEVSIPSSGEICTNSALSKKILELLKADREMAEIKIYQVPHRQKRIYSAIIR